MKYSRHPVIGLAIALALISACNASGDSAEEKNVGKAPESEAAADERHEPPALPVAEDFEARARDEIDADNLEAKVAELEAEAAPSPEPASGSR